MSWRLTVEESVVAEYMEASEYIIHEIEILEGIIKKIQRHNLDYKSEAYFNFLSSTVQQLRSLLEQIRFNKRKDGSYETR